MPGFCSHLVLKLVSVAGSMELLFSHLNASLSCVRRSDVLKTAAPMRGSPLFAGPVCCCPGGKCAVRGSAKP